VTTIKIAAAQLSPVFMDREATVDKACKLIAEAAGKGADLILFPEAYIPTYPDWVWAIPPGQGEMLGKLYAQLLEESVVVPSSAIDRLCAAVQAAGVYVVMGINERNTEASGASLYNTLLYISPEGKIMGKHRKLVPTGPERMVWAPGDGSTLDVYETPLGKVSGLICWENYMPLARYALYAWGVQIYLAPTWDRGEGWLGTLQHIAREGRVLVVGCCMALRKDDIPDHFEFKEAYYAGAGEWINTGDSAIVAPSGAIIAGPLHSEEGILYAEIDLAAEIGSAKWSLDVAGHYGRPDVLQLTVHKAAHPMLSVGGRPGAAVQPATGEVEVAANDGIATA
jgi:nitrilase